MAGLVLAMIAGAMVPAIAVALAAGRSPVPRACGSGPATTTAVEGAFLYTTGPDLWYSEGFPGHPRKLVDYAPVRRRVNASASPSAGVPSAAPSGPSSPAPTIYPPRLLAADISADRKEVAFVVEDPSDRYASISMRVLSPLDPPGTAPVEPWYGAPDRGREDVARVRVLDTGKVLFFAPVVPPWLPAPSPAPAGAPSASPGALPGTAVVEYAPTPKPAVVALGPEAYFVAQGRSAWPDAKGYRPPPPVPSLRGRVDGPSRAVAGIAERELGTPLSRRRVEQLVLGTAGEASTRVVCATLAGATPTAFSPDESHLVLQAGAESILLDLSGSHSPSRLLTGRVLTWR